MQIDCVQRGLQRLFAIRFHQATDRQILGVVRRMPGNEQDRDSAPARLASDFQAGLVAAQPNVAENEVDPSPVHYRDGLLEIVVRRDDLIAGIFQHHFIVECGQRLILDDEHALDAALSLPEQHLHPVGQFSVKPQRTKRHPVPQSRSAARPEAREDGKQRIAKLLARAGIASRREVERMIAEGRIALDGKVLETPATLLDDLKGVTVDGKPVKPPAAARLYRFYKPAGVLTAANDPKGRPTIYDRLPAGLPRLMPVGRLDYNTEGLLLMTNDGGLKRQLELPSSGVRRVYRARAFGDVTQSQLENLAEGVTIEGVRYGSIDANMERRTGRNCWIELALTEGKNREVRRVLEHLGMQVSRLIRIAYGPFTVEDLAPGKIAEIGREELFRFRQTLK